MSHLGDRVSDLVDGRLAPDVADRALAHLALCRPCRDEVDAERLVKRRLIALPAPPPTVDLVGRLLTMGGPAGPMAPRPAHVPGTPRVAALPGPGRPAGRQSRTRRPAAARTVGPGPRGRRPGPGRPAQPRPGIAGSGIGRALRHRRGRMAAAVLGALSAVGVGVGGLLLVAAPGTATVVPPLESFVVDHASTAGVIPFAELPAAWFSPGAAATAGGGR